MDKPKIKHIVGKRYMPPGFIEEIENLVETTRQSAWVFFDLICREDPKAGWTKYHGSIRYAAWVILQHLIKAMKRTRFVYPDGLMSLSFNDIEFRRDCIQPVFEEAWRAFRKSRPPLYVHRHRFVVVNYVFLRFYIRHEDYLEQFTPFYSRSGHKTYHMTVKDAEKLVDYLLKLIIHADWDRRV